MARGVNTIQIIGNLGADPKTKALPSGTSVCELRVAVGRSGGRDKDDVTDWFNVTTWDKLAETCDKYLRKGSKVYLSGEMRSRTYEDKETDKKITVWELHAFQMQMLDSKADSDDRDDRPARRSSRDDDDRPARRSSRDDDDEPKRPARRAARDDDEDDDEPEPPRRSRR